LTYLRHPWQDQSPERLEPWLDKIVSSDISTRYLSPLLREKLTHNGRRDYTCRQAILVWPRQSGKLFALLDSTSVPGSRKKYIYLTSIDTFSHNRKSSCVLRLATMFKFFKSTAALLATTLLAPLVASQGVAAPPGFNM